MSAVVSSVALVDSVVECTIGVVVVPGIGEVVVRTTAREYVMSQIFVMMRMLPLSFSPSHNMDCAFEKFNALLICQHG